MPKQKWHITASLSVDFEINRVSPSDNLSAIKIAYSKYLQDILEIFDQLASFKQKNITEKPSLSLPDNKMFTQGEIYLKQVDDGLIKVLNQISMFLFDAEKFDHRDEDKVKILQMDFIHMLLSIDNLRQILKNQTNR